MFYAGFICWFHEDVSKTVFFVIILIKVVIYTTAVGVFVETLSPSERRS